ncbi:unnamed protein product [Closterium sp. NIES-54]
MMTPRKELLDVVRAAPINKVCSAFGHTLKVAGAGRAVFKGVDGNPVVLHDVLLVPDLKANLISLRKLAKAGVSTSTDGARTHKGQLGNRCRKLPDGWRPGEPSIEGSKGLPGAMGEGMGSEEGDGGAGRHGGMFYHIGEACSEDMVVPASNVALHRSSHLVIDTGAFMTMTNREDLLDEVRPSKAANVVSATGQVVPVRGEGRAMFMGADGRLVRLKRVLVVPGLCANLRSTKALSEAGMKMEMMGTKVFKATLDGRMLWNLRGSKDMHWSMWEIPCCHGRRRLRTWLLKL